jgi:deoxyribonuclease-4
MSAFLFGTVGSPLSSPKNPGGTIAGIQRTAELGLSCMEIGWVHSVAIREDTCLKIKDISSKYTIPISIHAPYYINLNADEDEWPKSRERLLQAARLGYLAGATDVVFHPGSYMKKTPDQALATAMIRLMECREMLDEENNPVFLRPETMGKQGQLGTFSEVISLSMAVSGVLPCLDAAHVYARTGDGSLNDRKTWEILISEYAMHLGDRSLKSLHIHVSGIQFSAKGEVKHLPGRESGFRYDCLFSVLKSLNCSGRILCESPLMEEDGLFLRDAFELI